MGKKDELILKNNIQLNNGILFLRDCKIEIPGLKLLEIIGNGANAVVLKAIDLISEQIYAIKIWVPESDESIDKEQGRMEIKKIAALANSSNNYSPHLLKYYKAGSAQGYYFCVMEYIDSKEYSTLRPLLERKGHLKLGDRYAILNQVVKGLRVAHENGIFHGDLHPDNVMISKSYEVKIIDFGTSFKNINVSIKRDNRLMLELMRDILGDYYDRRILLINQPLNSMPQNCIRLIIKAASKILVLINFWHAGKVETVIDDIARFATIVPFFDLKYILEILLNDYPEDKAYEMIFKERVLTEILGGDMINKNIYYSSTEDIPIDILLEHYKLYQKSFLKICEESLLEEKIYKNFEQARIFNAPLFGSYVGLYSEENAEREEIKRIIE